MKQAAPANFAGMNDGVGISGNAIENRAGGPRLARGFDGHINDDRRADNVLARDAAGVAAVERIAAIIAHDEVAAGGNGVRKNIFLSGKGAEIVVRVGGFAAANGVLFVEADAVDPHGAVADVHGFAGQTDDALDDVGRFAGKYGTEDDDLPALGRAPQLVMNIGEGDADIVAEAAHDEVIADEQRIFHGAGRNDARLADGGVDEKENQNEPSPRDDFAADFLLRREIFFGFGLFCWFRFHASP